MSKISVTALKQQTTHHHNQFGREADAKKSVVPVHELDNSIVATSACLQDLQYAEN